MIKSFSNKATKKLYEGGDAQSWLNLQQAFDLKTGQAELEEELNHIMPMAMMT